MTPPYPPSNLEAVCGFSVTGSARHHIWSPAEYFAIRSCAGAILRLRLRRCWVCDAFQLSSLGGDADALDELLEFATPIPPVSGWISHEQPGHENVAEQLPRRKRRKRSGYGRRGAA